MRSLLPSSTIILLLAALGGCSLIVQFDAEDRPCGEDDDRDGNGDCLAGYSCLINTCVRDQSVPVGETCSVNAHCQRGAICTTVPFICREACANPFGARECDAGAGCALMTDAGGAMVGACRASECTTTCPDAREVCALAKSGAGFCLDSCALTCTDGACTGNCSFGPESQARECNVVGQNRALACMPQGLQPHGTACDLKTRHCVQGASCVLAADGSFGVCLQYCDPGYIDPCGALLDPATGAPAVCQAIPNQSVGLCGTLPAAPTDDGAAIGDPGSGDPAGGDDAGTDA